MSSPYAAGVFAKRHVSDPEKTLLDPPMSTPPFQELGCVGTRPRRAGHRILRLFAAFAVAVCHAVDFADLLQTRPVEMAGQTCAGL